MNSKQSIAVYSCTSEGCTKVKLAVERWWDVRVLCCDALFRDGWDRDKEVAGDDMVVVPPQNWLMTSTLLFSEIIICSAPVKLRIKYS